MEEAGLVARDDARRAGRGGVAELVVGERAREDAVPEPEAPTEPAARLGFSHLDDGGARGVEQRPGRVADTEVAQLEFMRQ